MVKLFLDLIPWIDPHRDFWLSCSLGHLEIVKLLLADHRLTDSKLMNRSLATAAGDGQVEVLRLLLADRRFDPSPDGDDVLDRVFFSCLYHQENPTRRARSFKCAELLLNDERVLVSPPRFVLRNLDLLGAAVLDSRTRAYLLLKRSFRQFVLIYKPETEEYRDEKDLKRAKLVTQIAQDPLMKEVLSIEKQILSCLDVYLISDLSSLCVDYLPDYSACSHLLSSLRP
jgi:hypothetical protein